MINFNHYQYTPTDSYLADLYPTSHSSTSRPNDEFSWRWSEGHSNAYATLLRAALFGPDARVVPPVKSEKQRSLPMSPPSLNIFKCHYTVIFSKFPLATMPPQQVHIPKEIIWGRV